MFATCFLIAFLNFGIKEDEGLFPETIDTFIGAFFASHASIAINKAIHVDNMNIDKNLLIFDIKSFLLEVLNKKESPDAPDRLVNQLSQKLNVPVFHSLIKTNDLDLIM